MQKFWKRQRQTSTEAAENVALANTQPFSSSKDNESSESIKTPAPAAQTVTYESVPIPQGYSTPLGPVHAPTTPGARSFRAVEPGPFASDSHSPRFGTGNRSSYMGASPLANSGFTPLRREPMTPKTPGTFVGDPKTPLSPTFREEQILEKHEAKVEKLDQRDLRWKIRVRMGKVVLRCLNFACSLVVLALISSTLVIFHATKNLPRRNNLPPWDPNTKLWVQYTVLGIAITSVCISIIILLAYWRGGHRRAERLAIYWTVMAISSFIFIIVIWSVVGGLTLTEKANGAGKDLWGWACKDNTRRALFSEDVDYKLVCRQVDWVFVCAIIEIVVELLAIALYVFVFYRVVSKRRLRKSMDLRDKARNDVYLAKLREQDEEPECPLTANNTALNAKSGNDAGPYFAAEEGRSNHSQQTFQLMPAPPRRARTSQDTRRTNDSAPVTPATGPGLGPRIGESAPAVPPSPGFPAYTPHADYNSSVAQQQATQPQTVAYNPTNYSDPTVPATPRSVSFMVNNNQSAALPPPPATPRSVAFRSSVVQVPDAAAGPGTPRLVKTVLMGRTPSPPEGGVPMTPRSAMAGSRAQTPPESQQVPPTPRSVSFRA